MSQAADLNRDKRRQWAAPGGSHDRRVRIMARWLPGMVGVIVAAMIIQPLFPRGEVSFLLDRTKVAVTQDRVRVADAMYRGIDNQGRPFTVTAGNAVQQSAREPVVKMDDLSARIRMSDGPAELTAANGAYDYDREQVTVPGQVLFTAADGYRLAAGNVSIDLKTRRVVGGGGVNGSIPAGTFSANRIVADLGARTVALEGNARLLMAPGKLRMP